jgi:hypothetical protein
MRQLPDILIEKKQTVGGWAEIGRLMGGLSGQLIGKYASGKSVPALDFAIEWKKAFNENLIDLLLDDPGKQKQDLPKVAEPEVEYNADKRLIKLQAELIECMAARLRMEKELVELKNFTRNTERTTKLKK